MTEGTCFSVASLMSVDDRYRDICETEMANVLMTRAMMMTMITKLAPFLFPGRNMQEPPVNHCVSMETTQRSNWTRLHDSY